MTFWAYMLHCHAGFFYVGHTDDLEKRVWQHENGVIPGFTHDHLPVKLVWCADFGTRDDAKAMEHRVKGWSRAKKLALIRGDFVEISRLAQNRTGLRQAQADGFWVRQAVKEKKAGLRQAQPDGELAPQNELSRLAEPVKAPPSPLPEGPTK